MISPMIFNSNLGVTETQNSFYFTAWADGSINPKPSLMPEIRLQVEAAINILNLNHAILKSKRSKDVLNGLIEASRNVPTHQRSLFWKNKFTRLLKDTEQPFRQFLLIYIGNKIGIN
jgi:hypothetical protein